MSKKSVKKCKISTKEKKGKLIMEVRGYCDTKNPNKKTDKDYEIDLRGFTDD